MIINNAFMIARPCWESVTQNIIVIIVGSSQVLVVQFLRSPRAPCLLRTLIANCKHFQIKLSMGLGSAYNYVDYRAVYIAEVHH